MEAPDQGLPSRSSRASEIEMVHRPLLEKTEESDNEDDEGDCITKQPETSDHEPVATESSFEQRQSLVLGVPKSGEVELRGVQWDPRDRDAETNVRRPQIMSMPAMRKAPPSLSYCSSWRTTPRRLDDVLCPLDIEQRALSVEGLPEDREARQAHDIGLEDHPKNTKSPMVVNRVVDSLELINLKVNEPKLEALIEDLLTPEVLTSHGTVEDMDVELRSNEARHTPVVVPVPTNDPEFFVPEYRPTEMGELKELPAHPAKLGTLKYMEGLTKERVLDVIGEIIAGILTGMDVRGSRSSVGVACNWVKEFARVVELLTAVPGDLDEGLVTSQVDPSTIGVEWAIVSSLDDMNCLIVSGLITFNEVENRYSSQSKSGLYGVLGTL